MVNIKKPELLAPAGDIYKLKTAFAYGADAVYAGWKQFGLRAASVNFTVEELAQAVNIAKTAGKKFYLTLNTTPLNSELDKLEEIIRQADDAGVDAVIVADIGVTQTVKRIAPDMDIHISTQAGVTNYITALALYEMGAKRIILARELSLDDIRLIREKLPVDCEIEVFVHGAMCVSFSGRCLLSNYMTGRDANHGECAQPCRWNYNLVEEKHPGEYFPVFEDEDGTYILNSKDLCLIEHIDKLIDAGVDSVKIEGRVKTDYYVASVTGAYRRAIDNYVNSGGENKFDPALLEEVRKVSHRDYYTGFLFGNPADSQNYNNGGYIRDYELIAVIEKAEGCYLHCRIKNALHEGDKLEILSPEGSASFAANVIIDPETQERVKIANCPEKVVCIPYDGCVSAPAFIRKKVI